MDRLSSYAVDPVSAQLALLNLMLFVYLVCKGLNYASASLFRRNPPRKKSIDQGVARPDRS